MGTESAAAAIFLFLPLVLWEIPEFWQAARFQGDRPWLGILFWSTFSTSAVLYFFVASVFLFMLPQHALAQGFRKVIGWFCTIADRPFTAIAWTMIWLVSLGAIGSAAYLIVANNWIAKTGSG